MSAEDTRTKILNVAEKLFAERGYGATPLRAIIAEAGVNQAAIHYHFRNRESLFSAVVNRRLLPLEQERLRRFVEIEERWGAEPPPIEKVVEAFVEPTLKLAQSEAGLAWIQFVGQSRLEPGAHWNSVSAQHDEVLVRFVELLKRCLPELRESELLYRTYFLIGVVANSLIDRRTMEKIGQTIPDLFDQPDVVLDHLVDFVSAGLRAPRGS